MPKIESTKVFSLVNEAFHDESISVCSMQGSSRSGKTYNIMIWLVAMAVKNKLTISIVRRTLPSIKMTVLRDFKDIMIRLKIYNDRKFNKSEMVYTFPNGSIIEFFSVDNEQKIRGAKRDILFCNEANELDFDKWTQLMLRTTMFKIIDYNPSFSESHWIHRIVNQNKDTAFHITTYNDNPYLEDEVIKAIESLKDTDPNLWKVYGLGVMGEIEGLIFHFKEVKEVPEYAKKKHYRGIDFGYTNDPTAIVDVYVHDKTIYIEEIAYRTHMLTSDIISELKDDTTIDVISESADPRLVDEIYNAGINIYPVTKFPDSINAGIAKMKEFKLCVTERSINVQKEFKNYIYQRDKEGNFINKPIDKFNHAIDAIRYVVLERVINTNEKEIDYDEIENIAY